MCASVHDLGGKQGVETVTESTNEYKNNVITEACFSHPYSSNGSAMCRKGDENNLVAQMLIKHN